MMNFDDGESHIVKFSPALPNQGAFFSDWIYKCPVKCLLLQFRYVFSILVAAYGLRNNVVPIIGVSY
jgi:hypothetical protein